MKNTNIARIALCAGLSLALSAGVYAQNGPTMGGGPGKGGPGMGMANGKGQPKAMHMRRRQPPSPEQVADNMSKELNLSEEQHENVKALIASNQPLMREFSEKMKKLKIDIRNRMFAADSTLEEVYGLIDQLAVAQSEHMKRRVENQFKLKEILSPEQYEKFLESARNRMQGRKRTFRRRFQVTQTVNGKTAPKLPDGPEVGGQDVPTPPPPPPSPEQEAQ